MGSKDSAAAMRVAFKAKGWSARKVSVRVRGCGYSSAIDVSIRDASVAKRDVEAIAFEHRSVRYCHMSGEVLMGGNCYVDVEYAHGILDGVKAEIAEAIKDIEAGEVRDVRGFRVYRDSDGPGPMEFSAHARREDGEIDYSEAVRAWDVENIVHWVAEHSAGRSAGRVPAVSEEKAA